MFQKMLKYYVYLNPGLTIVLPEKNLFQKMDLKICLRIIIKIWKKLLYPIIHLKGNDIEIAITHSKVQYSEEYYSFVNGQHTTQGGTHQSAFRESLVKYLEIFLVNPMIQDIRKSIIASISIKVMEPVFESQTKTKTLDQLKWAISSVLVRSYINDFVGKHLDNFLHKNPEIADAIQKKDYAGAEKERKELSEFEN